MKINKLTIKNIFSIVDATVNFDAEPLTSADVFLITGPTGAGKSTIFDAVCLALFNKTPRMANSKMQGKFVDESKKEILVDDCRQYLRKNTGEGWVNLEFTGNDGLLYTAKWRVYRANCKPEGALQQKKWSLTAPDGRVYDKDKEIEPMIKELVGLNFDQFCRTSMLAQGDFTKFLDSEDNDKAEILEKVTGLDEYAVIGKRLSEETKAKKNAYESLKTEIDKTVTLSDEDIEKYNAELKALYAEDKKLGAEKTLTENSLNWLISWNKAVEDLSNKKELSEAASAKTMSQKFIDEKQFLTDWQNSIEARSAMNAIDAAQKQIAKQEEVITAEKRKTMAVLAGEKWIEAQIESTKKDIEKIGQAMKPFEAKSNAYSNVQTVLTALSSYADNTDAVSDSQSKKTKEKENIAKYLQPVLEDKKADLAQKVKNFEVTDAQLKEMSNVVDALKLNELRKEQSALIDRIRDIDSTNEKLDAYTKARDSYNKKTSELADKKVEIEQNKKMAELSAMGLEQEKKVLAILEVNYNTLTNSVNKWAKALRSQLTKGCKCPVCQQTIKNDIDEAELDKEANAAFTELNTAKDKYKEDEQKYNKMTAQFNADEKQYAAEKMAHDADTTVTDAATKLQNLCGKMGISYQPEQPNSLFADLENMKANADKQLKDLNKKIEEGEKQEESVKLQQKEVEKLRKLKDQADMAVRTAEKNITDANTRIAGFDSAIKAANDNIIRAKNTIQPLVDGLDWGCDWTANAKDFGAQISDEAKQYKNWQDRLEKDHQNMEAFDKALSEVSMVVEDIMKLQPEWNGLEAGQPSEVENINSMANNIRTAIASTKELIKSANRQITESQLVLSAFYAANPSLTEERLLKLDSCTQNEKAERDRMVQSIESEAKSANSLMQDAQKKVDELQKNSEIKKGDTIESLTKQKADMDESIKALSGRKSELALLLNQNAEKLRQIGSAKDRLTKLKAEYEKWDALNQLIGDAEGNKFRKIAQSYVLVNVVEAANNYMQTLTNRYKLSVEPGTLIINVEDSFQGYAQRAASTISGGEKFIVSLALALGLSSMANGLSVDMLFIDEGFGTLSGKELNNAIDTLKSLHRTNKQVGIISHVDTLKENIDVQIQLDKNETTASSTIKVVSHCA